MSALHEWAKSCFEHPRGLLGWMAGQIMFHRNACRTQTVVDRLDLHADDAVLEIGCGPGAALRRIAPQLTTGHVTAIDPSILMLRMAARYVGEAVMNGTVRLVLGAYPHVDLPAHAYDVIFMVNVHLFWEDPVSAFHAISRHLASGGTVHLFFHPHWLGDEEHVRQLGKALRGDVAAAHLTPIALDLVPMPGVPMIHLRAVHSRFR